MISVDRTDWDASYPNHPIHPIIHDQIYFTSSGRDYGLNLDVSGVMLEAGCVFNQ
jgi:hypothetical protein